MTPEANLRQLLVKALNGFIHWVVVAKSPSLKKINSNDEGDGKLWNIEVFGKSKGVAKIVPS